MLVVLLALPVSAQFKRATPDYPPAGEQSAPLDQPSNPPPDSQPPPDAGSDPALSGNPEDAQHGVGRIAQIGGEVNVQRAAGGELVAAAVNAPLMAQDHLLTGSRSNAEIQLDDANVLRLAENSDVAFDELRRDAFRAQLFAGSVTYRVLRAGSLQGEVDTPNIGIRALGPAEIRIWVMDSNNTRIFVRSGEAEMLGPGGTERLVAGHAYQVRGSAADPEFQETAPPARDTFDDWSSARDGQLLNSPSSQYIPPGVPGAEDLDANGTWVPSTHGQVWQPTGVPPGWAPYSYGQWVYSNYYGWTWVDYAPWGWTPYHYGRWFFNAGFGWCWWPGARIGFRHWSPAQVGFFSWHGGYRGLGWVPLAPYERFHPWWGARARPFTYGGSVLATYRNAGYRGGATYASFTAFGTPGQRYTHISRDQIASASFLAGHLPVTPSRNSYWLSPRQAFDPGHFVRPAVSRPGLNSFVRQPSASFATRPAAAGWSRPGAGQAVRGFRPPLSGVQEVQSQARFQQRPQQGSRGPDSGWRRFGDPGSSVYNPQRGFVGNGNAGSDNGGWHQFGRPAPSPEVRGSGWGSRGRSARPNYSPPPSYRSPSQSRYAAPQTFHAPAQPHYSAPSQHGGNAGGRGGGRGR